MIRIVLLKPHELARYKEQLALFEQAFQYEWGDQQLTVSHGDDYTSFFRSIGAPRFLLALEKRDFRVRIVGLLALVATSVNYSNHRYPAVYLGDLKILKKYQLTGLSERLYRIAERLLAMHKLFKNWRCIYFFTLHNRERFIDFMGIKAKSSPLHKFSVLGYLMLYSTPVRALEKIALAPDLVHERVIERSFLQFCPNDTTDAAGTSVVGKKQFALNKKYLSMAHIVTALTSGSNYIQALQRGAQQASKQGKTVCNFALDGRRPEVAWLEAQGITTTIMLTVYGIMHDIPSLRIKGDFFLVLDTYLL